MSFGQNKRHKKYTLFSFASSNYSFTLNSIFLCELQRNFDSALLLLQFVFLLNKKQGLFDLKTS